MDSEANTKQTDPRDAGPGLSTQDVELVARADERLAHAYEQIARADEQLSRVNEQISRMEHDAAQKKAVNKLHRPAADCLHLYCCLRFALLWRDGQADDLPLGTAIGGGFVAAVGNTEACRRAERACRSAGGGGCDSFAIAISGSECTARRGTNPDLSRGDTVAPNDVA